LYDVLESKTKVYLVLELMEGGELFSYITCKGCVPEPEAKFVFYQLLSAVQVNIIISLYLSLTGSTFIGVALPIGSLMLLTDTPTKALTPNF
jgi:serine/threonine protein kinase